MRILDRVSWISLYLLIRVEWCCLLLPFSSNAEWSVCWETVKPIFQFQFPRNGTKISNRSVYTSCIYWTTTKLSISYLRISFSLKKSFSKNFLNFRILISEIEYDLYDWYSFFNLSTYYLLSCKTFVKCKFKF